jgi:hypothetical protein
VVNDEWFSTVTKFKGDVIVRNRGRQGSLMWTHLDTLGNPRTHNTPETKLKWTPDESILLGRDG